MNFFTLINNKTIIFDNCKWQNCLILLLWIFIVLMPITIYANATLCISTDVGFVIDGGEALKAFLDTPYGIAIDQTKGAILIADMGHHRIRKILDNKISTIAGNGLRGITDNDIPATSAKLNKPTDVAIDSQGNIYIADTVNSCIRKISDGIISVYAGTPGDNSCDNSEGILATDACLSFPEGIAIDHYNDNLYIADTGNNLIKIVYSENQRIYTFAGNGMTDQCNGDGGYAHEANLMEPKDIYVDANNDIWIADTGHHRILKVESDSYLINKVVGADNCAKGYDEKDDGKQAKNAKLNSPTSIAIDSAGNLYIADTDNNRIRKVEGAHPDGIITTYAGGGSEIKDGVIATEAELPLPIGIAFDKEDNLIVSLKGNNLVRKIIPEKGPNIVTIAGRWENMSKPKLTTLLNKPNDVCSDDKGYYYIADTDNDRVLKLDPEGQIVIIASSGSKVNESIATFKEPTAILLGKEGKYLYVSEPLNHWIRRIDLSTVPPTLHKFAGNGYCGSPEEKIPAEQTRLNSPAGLCSDSHGDIYFADKGNQCVFKIVLDDSPEIEEIAGSSDLNEPVDVWVDCTGRIFILDAGTKNVLMIDNDSNISTILNNFEYPLGLTGYKYKGKEYLLITDLYNHNIFRMDIHSLPWTAEIIAGNKPGLDGDGGLATQARLNCPMGITTNIDGEIIFADKENNRIRKLSCSVCGTSSIQIKTIAGMFKIDGKALETAIRDAKGVAVDPNGNVYYSDSQNHRVNKIYMVEKKIEAYAGNGTAGFSGDAHQALSAQLNSPQHLVYSNKGELFIVDRGNHAIRKVDRKGIITTLIGNGFPGQCGFPTDDLMTNCLNDPSGIAVDSDNILYISDSKNNRIVKLNINDESTSCAINADLNSPAGLSINKDNILYVADLGNNRIQKIDQENNFDTYADNIDSPTDIVIDSINNAYTFITSQHQVLSINKDKKITVIAGTGSSSCNHEDEDPENSTLKTPVALALYEQEKLFVADNCNRIVQIHLQDNTFSSIAGNGKSTFCGDDGPALSASLNGPFDVASDQWNNIYVADTNNHRIRKITPDGIITTIAGNDNPGYTGDGGPAINASLNYPHDVAIDLYGNVYIADTNNHCIRVVWQNNIFNEVHKVPGTIETLAGNPDGISLNSPKGISVDISGYIYIADTGNNAIKKVNIETRELITIANGFNAPHDVAVNQQRKVYVADTLNNKIKIVSPDGRILQVSVTEPSLTFPTCIDLDAKNFYIVDKGNHCIRKVPLSSIESHPQIQTIAGNGVSGFSGENWNPISASLNSPTGVAVAADAHIVLVDSGNNLIRKIVSEEYPNWIVNTTDLKHLGNIIASVYFKGYPTGNMGDKISCFINDECNGVAYPIKTIKGTRFFISVWGTGFEGGLIHFKYFHNADKIIYPIKQHIWVQELSDNDHTIDNPKIFEIIHVMDFPEKIINLTSENINLTSENNNQKLTITSLNTKIKVLDNEKDNLNSIVDSQSITIITLESIVDSQSLTINTLENEVVELENIVDSQSYSIYSLSSYSLTLSAGWHLLSSLNVEGITPATEPSNCITAIFQFNTDTNSYQKIKRLTPTQGFWIKLKQKCRLIISPHPDSLNLIQK